MSSCMQLLLHCTNCHCSKYTFSMSVEARAAVHFLAIYKVAKYKIKYDYRVLEIDDLSMVKLIQFPQHLGRKKSQQQKSSLSCSE